MTRRGFTTIELVIVIVVIGILVSVGLPRLRGALLKSNLRSAKLAFVTEVAKAQAAAVARGCRSTLNVGTDGVVSIGVCRASGVGFETLGGVDSVASRYKVQITPSIGTLQFDPRGLSVGFTGMSVLFQSGTDAGALVDTVIINPLGKVVKQ